ncbi:hypothetical protein [Clostridium sp. Marseille-Q7071]
MKPRHDSDILEFIDEFGGITIEQANKIFFRTKYGYDTAKRRLKKLKEEGLLKVDKDFLTQKNVYYTHKKPSSHTVLLLNIYAEFRSLEVEIVHFEKEFKILNKRADAMMVVKHKSVAKILLVEIDINNKTKDNKYQKLFETGEVQKAYGTFPIVLVVEKERIRKAKREKVGYKIERIDYSLEGLKKVI